MREEVMVKKDEIVLCEDYVRSKKNPSHTHTCSSPKHPLGAHFCPDCKEWWGKA